MNLYKIYQTVNKDYDTYDSCVVAAMCEEDAIKIHPSGDNSFFDTFKYSWCDKKDVKVKLIGKAVDGTEEGIVLASFNAG